MPIIDRYLLRQFLRIFAICFCSLTGLFIVIDGFGNLEEFISYAQKHGTNLLAVMGPYYAYRSLSFFDRTSGILTLISAVFTVTWLQRHNEFTALQAAGISKSRVVLPVIVAVVAICICSAANREVLIPSVKDHLGRNAQDLEGAGGRQFKDRYDYETGILFRGRETFTEKQRIARPQFLLFPPLDQYGKDLTAENAYYRPPEGDKPGGYLLEQVESPKDLDRQPSLGNKRGRVVLTSLDTLWLKPGQCFVVSNVSFEQLEEGSAWRQYSSIAELIRGMKNPSLEFGPDIRVSIHSRIVQPILDLTLLFLGLPLVLARENRNMFAAIGLCVGIVALFMMVVLGCQALGANALLKPALAAWLPLIVFVPWAAGLSDPLFE